MTNRKFGSTQKTFVNNRGYCYWNVQLTLKLTKYRIANLVDTSTT